MFGPRNRNGFTNSCWKWFCRSCCDNYILFMLPNHRLSTNAELPRVAEGEKQPHFPGSLRLPDRRLEPGGDRSLLPGNKWQDKGKRPQVAQRVICIGY